MHKLIDINRTERTAICSECGPTVIKRVRADKDYYRCMTPVRVSRRKYNREYNRKNWRRWKQDSAGRNPKQRQAVIEAQGGRCAMCGEEARLEGDHDHKTGKAREMLCRRCNLLLGLARDDPEVLRKALRYLRRHSRNE